MSRRTTLRTRLTVSMLAVALIAVVLTGFGTAILQQRSVVASQQNQLLHQAQSIATEVDVLPPSVDQVLGRVIGVTGIGFLPYDTSGNLVLNQDINRFATPLPAGLAASDFPPASLAAGRAVSGRVGNTVFAAAPAPSTALFMRCAAGAQYVSSAGACLACPAGTTLNVSTATCARGAGAAGGSGGGRLRPGRTTTTTAPLNTTPVSTSAQDLCPTCAGALIILQEPVNGQRRIVGYLLLASAIAIAIAAVVAAAVSRRTTRPLTTALDATRRIAAGDLQTRAPTHAGDYRELNVLSESINTMAATLHHARDMERNFLLSVTHELRTPLTSIRGFAEAIADDAAPDIPRAAGVIGSEARRLERLVGDLLDLAKLDAKRFSMNLRRTDVAEVALDTAEGFRPTLDAEGLTLEISFPTGTEISVNADPDRLAQVLANLLENAFKYARTGVRVVAGIREGRVVVGVEDDGPGIPPEDLPLVFERLFSSSRTPSRRAGTGLGLALVSEFVHAMGGSVRADSPLHDGGGTMMVVTFAPYREVPPPGTAGNGADAPVPPDEGERLRSPDAAPSSRGSAPSRPSLTGPR